MKKKMALLLSIIMLICSCGINVAMAEGENVSDGGIIYEWDFEDYTGGSLTDYGWVRSQGTASYKTVSTFDGSKALYIASGKSGGANVYKFAKPVKDGVYYASIDFGFDAVSDKPYYMVFFQEGGYATANDTTKAKRLLWANPESVTDEASGESSLEMYLGASELSGNFAGIKGKTANMSTDKLRRGAVSYDFATRVMTWYAEGKKIHQKTLDEGTIESFECFAFYTTGGGYADNIKVQDYVSSSFVAERTTILDNTLTVQFANDINPDSVPESGVVLKNPDDDTTLAVTSIEQTDYNALKLTYEGEVAANVAYEIVFPESFTDVVGSSLYKNPSVVLRTAAESEVNNSAKDSIIYEWDFEDYAGGALTNYGWIRSQGTASYKKSVEFDDSKALYVAPENSGGANVYKFSESVKDGVYYASIDFGFDAVSSSPYYMGLYQEGGYTTSSDTSKSYRVLWANSEAVTDETSGETSVQMYIGASELSSNIAGIKGKTANMSTDRLHRGAVSYDFATRVMTWYADGKKIHQKTLEEGKLESVECFAFYTTGGGYADNIKVQKYDETTFVVEKAVAEDKTVTVKFSNDLNPDTVKASGVVLKNLYDGTELEVTSIEQTDYDTVKLTYSGNATPNDEYEIVFPESFTDILGSQVYESTVLNLALAENDFAMKKVSFTDYYGNRYNITDEVFTVLGKAELTFSKNVDEETAKSGISITSEDGNEFAGYNVSVLDNVVTLAFTSPLFGNRAYSVNVKGVLSADKSATAKDYSLSFRTGSDAAIFELVDSAGKVFTFGEESTGDKLYLKTRLVNSGDTTKSYRLMLAKFTDGRLSELAHKTVEVSSGELFEISNLTDEVVSVTKDNLLETEYKIFIWDAVTFMPCAEAKTYYNGDATEILYNNASLVAPEGEFYAVDINGVKYISVDFLAEKSAYSLSKDETTARLTKNTDSVVLEEGNVFAKVNDEAVALFDAPIIRDGEFYITAASVGEILPIAEDLTPNENGVSLHDKFYGDDYTFWGITTTFTGNAKNERGFSWQAKPEHDDMVIEYSEDENLTDAVQIKAVSELAPIVYNHQNIDPEKSISYYENMLFYKVSLSGLKPGTTYSYRVGDKTDNLWSDIYTFKTEAENADSFSMIAVTDSHVSDAPVYSKFFTDTLSAALKDAPDAAFIANAGDLINNYGMDDNEWDDYYYSMKGFAEKLPIVTVVGNHETRALGTKYYNLRFLNPQNGVGLAKDTDLSALDKYSKAVIEELDNTVYSFDYGNAHFVVLNSGSEKGASKQDALALQREWLREDLKSTDKQWKVVIVHIPVQQNELVYDILDEYGVDLVMQGHTHHYVRTKPMKAGQAYSGEYDKNSVSSANGTVYTILGHAGIKPASGDTPTDEWIEVSDVTEARNPQYNILTFDDKKISFIAKALDGTVLDEFSITK